LLQHVDKIWWSGVWWYQLHQDTVAAFFNARTLFRNCSCTRSALHPDGEARCQEDANHLGSTFWHISMWYYFGGYIQWWIGE
jgi:hypothetical protein